MNRRLVDQVRTWLALSFVLGAGPAGLSPGFAQARAGDVEPIPRITIWVYNYAQVPGRTLAQAEKEIDRILAEAGVGTDWVECPLSTSETEVHPICQQRMSPAELALVIAPRFTAQSVGKGDTYFGSAQVFTNRQPGHYAYVFYDRVENRSLRRETTLYQMLANVAVHELGHLLLRSTAHSPIGLMRAQWDQSDLQRAAWGQLRFSSEESKRLRAEVLARAGQQEVDRVSGPAK